MARVEKLETVLDWTQSLSTKHAEIQPNHDVVSLERWVNNGQLRGMANLLRLNRGASVPTSYDDRPPTIPDRPPDTMCEQDGTTLAVWAATSLLDPHLTLAFTRRDSPPVFRSTPLYCIDFHVGEFIGAILPLYGNRASDGEPAFLVCGKVFGRPIYVHNRPETEVPYAIQWYSVTGNLIREDVWTGFAVDRAPYYLPWTRTLVFYRRNEGVLRFYDTRTGRVKATQPLSHPVSLPTHAVEFSNQEIGFFCFSSSSDKNVWRLNLYQTTSEEVHHRQSRVWPTSWAWRSVFPKGIHALLDRSGAVEGSQGGRRRALVFGEKGWFLVDFDRRGSSCEDPYGLDSAASLWPLVQKGPAYEYKPTPTLSPTESDVFFIRRGEELWRFRLVILDDNLRLQASDALAKATLRSLETSLPKELYLEVLAALCHRLDTRRDEI